MLPSAEIQAVLSLRSAGIAQHELIGRQRDRFADEPEHVPSAVGQYNAVNFGGFFHSDQQIVECILGRPLADACELSTG